MKKHLFYLFIMSLPLLVSCDDFSQDDELPPSSYEPFAYVADSSFVTKGQALSVVERLSPKTRAGQQKEVANVVALCNGTGDTLMYVVNYSDAQGYVVISATRNYHPVLAIVEKGTFTSTYLIPGGEGLYLDNYAQNISDLRSAPLDSVQFYRAEWAMAETSSESATTSTADQELTDFMNQSKVAWMRDGYDVSDLNQNKFGLSESARQTILRDAYAYKERDDYMTTSFVIRRPGYVTKTVGPLLTTEWGQNSPYNSLLFEKYDKQYVTGCVATAMAQIMKYYEKPSRYDWDNMPDRAYIESAGYPVAKLMFDIAEDVHIKYGTTKTTSDIDKALRTFKKFGYSNAKIVNHSFLDVISQISSYKHPVYMRGQNDEGGHAWVCDGVMASKMDTQIYLMILSANKPYKYTKYTEPTPGRQTSELYQFHMNWGWDGLHNGWFSDDNIKTSNGNFPNKRKDIIYIY